MNLTQKYLKELLHYEPDTGVFTWKVHRAPNARVGTVAGTPKDPEAVKSSYIQIQCTVDGVAKLYLAHRLAYLYTEGWMPEEVDHENRVRDDNRWENLRPATNAKNTRNRSKQVNNTSGYTGVVWYKRDKNWHAQIQHNGKTIHIGYFDCKHEAAHARNGKALELHGEFSVLNVIPEDYC